MNDTLDYKISVMQAAKEGKEIEYRCLELPLLEWRVSLPDAPPTWNWAEFDYRVKGQERSPIRLIGLEGECTPLLAAYADMHRASFNFNGAISTAKKVEFIELTDSVRAKLGL